MCVGFRLFCEEGLADLHIEIARMKHIFIFKTIDGKAVTEDDLQVNPLRCVLKLLM